MKTGAGVSKLLISKIIYTFFIVLIYIVGRSIPIYMVDPAEYMSKTVSGGNILTQTISGDLNRCSMLALGIFPYMIASMAQQIVMAFKSSKSRAGISPITSNRIMICIMLFLSVYQAYLRVQDLSFVPTDQVVLVKTAAVCELVAGAFLFLVLSERNIRYGIGGQSILIFVNILDGLISGVREVGFSQKKTVIILIVLAVIVTEITENVEKRIPLQRISVYNIFGDKDYQSIKLNPIGIMPVMFSSSVMMLFRGINGILYAIRPDIPFLGFLNENLTLSTYAGVGIYLVILFLLTLGFSYIFINPGDMVEALLQSGDSFEDLHPGKQTKRYLNLTIIGFSAISTIVLGACLALPQILCIGGIISGAEASIPMSAMMLIGMWNTIYQEAAGTSRLDGYSKLI